jgi:hypothetical protein
LTADFPLEAYIEFAYKPTKLCPLGNRQKRSLRIFRNGSRLCLGNLYIGDAGPGGLYASNSKPGYVVRIPVGGAAFKMTIPSVTFVYPQALATDPYSALFLHRPSRQTCFTLLGVPCVSSRLC